MVARKPVSEGPTSGGYTSARLELQRETNNKPPPSQRNSTGPYRSAPDSARRCPPIGLRLVRLAALLCLRARTHTLTHSRERRPANRTQAHFALSGASRRLVCSLDYGASARRRTSTQTNRQRRRSPMCAQTRAHSVALVCAGACAAASTFLSAGARRASLIVRQVHQRSHPSQTTTSTARHRHRHQRR